MELLKIFREEIGEVVGAYFDGEKIFLVRSAEIFERLELDAAGAQLEQVAEKISVACRKRGWKLSAVGFCLQDSDAVTYQMEVANVPEKELPALVKSWSAAQAGTDAAFAFATIGAEIWMETLPRTRLEEICAAFEKFGLNLRGLSVMPQDLLTKNLPFDKAQFIAAVVREKKTPNLLASRGSVWNWQKISQAVAAIFFCVILLPSAKILFEYHDAATQLDAAQTAIDGLRDELAVKQDIDADIAELNRLNKICAAQKISPKNFNFLLNAGKIAGGGVRLTSIRAEENFLELEGFGATPDAVRSYLSRVKNSVADTARLESSSEREDGDIAFVIRARTD